MTIRTAVPARSTRARPTGVGERELPPALVRVSADCAGVDARQCVCGGISSKSTVRSSRRNTACRRTRTAMRATRACWCRPTACPTRAAVRHALATPIRAAMRCSTASRRTTYDATVNVEKLPLEVQVTNPIQRMVLTDGAIGFVFAAARQQPVPDADRPGRQAAAVRCIGAGRGERQGTRHRRRGGAAFLTQVQPKSTLAVRAGERTLCTRHAAEPAPTRRHADSVTCQTPGESHAAARVER